MNEDLDRLTKLLILMVVANVVMMFICLVLVWVVLTAP